MGVKNLMKWIEKHAPSAIKHMSVNQLVGRTVAIDASMQIYQFLVSVRHAGNQLVDAEGNPTSHLSGLLSRTIYFVQNGIKPVYVFDGKPPEMKSGELQKRAEKRAEAEKQLESAIEQGNQEEIDRFSRRTVRLDQQHVDECKKLLTLMGIPWVQAPCEAEAQCAALCREKIVDATATEDMDALAHATPILVRHLTRKSKADDDSVVQIEYKTILEESGLTREEFVDFCILCGCDYCDSIKNIGPKRAFEMIKDYHNIETVIKHLDTNKNPLPEDFDYISARELFFHHEVDLSCKKFVTKKPDVEGLKQFMIEEKGFNQARIENAIAKLNKAKGGGQQTRMDSFFSSVVTKKPPTKADDKKKKETKKPPAKKK
ncbi:XPG I-region family protein [Tritrichomonas foetus]|uniref:Flap endonuclease 1 n=1 Tax=Tritrichomonas foetus TaxID=1144522 RepID=A0A1J4J7Y7_9EUKA|nr:XPG I-region family protein [Tritrichomonas foetus]|eukprot:OHS94785.1 XPG I-region family protein [Tritrichomonas foetus]